LKNLWNEKIQADLNSDGKAEGGSLVGSNSKPDKPEELKTDDTDPKPATQERKRLRQDQTEDETKTAVKQARPNDDAETTPALHLKDWWKDMQDSADKMCLTQRPNKTSKHGSASWHLVQVDPDETNNKQAKRVGEHHVKHHVQNVPCGVSHRMFFEHMLVA
jgi:hypothetical protein